MNEFKYHKDIENETLDETTKSMYKNDKETLYYVSGRKDTLNSEQLKYIETIQEFVEGIEAGIIKHWYKFFH